MEEENGPLLLTASYDSTIKIWSTVRPKWDCSKTVDIPKDVVINRMKINNDKQNLVCATSSGIKIYDLGHDSILTNKGNFSYPSNVTSIGLKKNGEWLYAGSEDGTIRLHDLRLSGDQILHKGESEINTVVLSPSEGEIISGDQDGTMMIYDLTAGKIREEMSPNKDISIRDICVSSDGRFVTVADSSGSCFVWEVNGDDLEKWQEFRAHEDYILKTEFSNDVKTFITCSADRTINVYNITEDKGFVHKKTLYGHTKWVWDCRFISDNTHLISVSTDSVLKVWDTKEGKMMKHSCQHKMGITCMALHD